MKGIIVQFRRGRKRIKERHYLLDLGLTSRDEAKKMAGKQVEWVSPSGKIIQGQISSAHGNNGLVRAIFKKGLPGQAITNEVIIKGPVDKKEAKKEQKEQAKIDKKESDKEKKESPEEKKDEVKEKESTPETTKEAETEKKDEKPEHLIPDEKPGEKVQEIKAESEMKKEKK